MKRQKTKRISISMLIPVYTTKISPRWILALLFAILAMHGVDARQHRATTPISRQYLRALTRREQQAKEFTEEMNDIPDSSSNQSPFGGFRRRGLTCPGEFVDRNVPDAKHYLTIQNLYMETFDSHYDMEPLDIYKLAVTAYVSSKVLPMDTPMPNVTIFVRHEMEYPVTIILQSQERIVLKPNKVLKLSTGPNAFGARFAVVPTPPHEHDFPVFRIMSMFMSKRDELAVSSAAHVLHSLAYMKSNDARSILKKLGRDHEAEDADHVNAFVSTINSLTKPVSKGRIINADENFKRSRLHKRSLKYQRVANDRVEYDPVSNQVQADAVNRDGILRHVLDTSASNHEHWEIYSNDQNRLVFQPHTDHSILLRKRDLKGAFLYVKDMFIDEVDDLKEKADDFFDEIAIKTNDVKEKLEDVSDKVFRSQHMMLSQATDGLQLTVYPNGTTTMVNTEQKPTIFRILIQSAKDALAVVKGFLKKIGIKLRELLEYVKATFNWDDILMNYQFMVKHYQKTINFMRNEVTNRKTGLAVDFANKLGKFGNITDDVLQSLRTRNVSELKNVVHEASEITDQMMQNQKIDIRQKVFTSFVNNADMKQQSDLSTPMGLQASFLQDHMIENFQKAEVQVNKRDTESLISMTMEAMKGMLDISNETYSQFLKELKEIKMELSKQNWNWKAVTMVTYRLARFSSELLLIKIWEGATVVFDLLVAIYSRILSYRIRIPFVTKLWEKKITRGRSNLTVFDIFALQAAVPLTVTGKLVNRGKNLLNHDELNVLMESASPEHYVDDLIAAAVETHGVDAVSLRPTYRRIVSYYLGASYASGQFFSSFGNVIADSGPLVYLFKGPFEFISYLNNYPWSWYTDTVTQVGINIRFGAWLAQFLPLVIGFAVEGSFGLGKFFAGVILAMSTLPQLYTVTSVWLQDLSLLNDKNGARVDGANRMDITMKSVARLMVNVPYLFLSFTKHAGPVSITLKSLIIAGASLHGARLYLTAMPMGAIYSV